MNLAWVVGVRGFIAFSTLLVFANILGKQQVGKLTFFDFITGITIGDLAATLTVDFNSRAWPHFVGLAVWSGLALLAQWTSLKSRWWGKVIAGEPAILIRDGKILEQNLTRNRYRYDDLMMQLREKNVFDPNEVEVAILETNGTLSVQKRSQYEPVTPHDLKLSTNYKGLGTELIYEGKIVEPNLKAVHLTRGWLLAELNKRGINDPSTVTLAILNTDGTLFVDITDDGPTKTPIDDRPLVK